jgi:hypothetical protein
MKYTAGQAAKAAGVSTATISRALKTGKISGVKGASGSFQIDPAELHRQFPPVAEKDSASLTMQNTAIPMQDRGLERLVDSLQEQIQDLRNQRDKWQEEAAHLRRLLPAPATDSPASGQGKPARGFWARLTGKTGAND